jgi:hypothetical protein
MKVSLYAKEVRTTDKIRYMNVEVISAPISRDILQLIPDAVRLENNNITEYVSKKAIVAIELYKEKEDKYEISVEKETGSS